MTNRESPRDLLAEVDRELWYRKAVPSSTS